MPGRGVMPGLSPVFGKLIPEHPRCIRIFGCSMSEDTKSTPPFGEGKYRHSRHTFGGVKRPGVPAN